MSTDRIIATAGDWAVADDGVQWILLKGQKRKPDDRRPPWFAVSFVRTTKDILARCMREKGVGADAMSFLLVGLPEAHPTWKPPRLSSKRLPRPLPIVSGMVPDAVWPNMWRVRLFDGSLSDMVSYTRAAEVARILAARLRKTGGLPEDRYGREALK